jgi:flagellar protein FlaJ
LNNEDPAPMEFIPEINEKNLEELEKDRVQLQMEESRKWMKLRHFLKSPQEKMKKEPIYALVFAIPVALIFLIIAGWRTGLTPAFDHVIYFTVLITIVPPGFLQIVHTRKIKKIEEYFPNFLRDISEINRSGMTLTRAVNTVAKGEYGDLSEEIKLIDASLSWGISFEESLNRFADRVSTSLILRSVALINQASKAGGNVPDVLEVAAKDAYTIKMMERERFSAMIVYVVIAYMSFFVFLFVIGILSYSFIPVMADAANQAAASGPQAAQFIQRFDPEEFDRLFFHAGLIQGFASGLVAGQMGEGNMVSGLKHSVILSMVAWITFVFII